MCLIRLIVVITDDHLKEFTFIEVEETKTDLAISYGKGGLKVKKDEQFVSRITTWSAFNVKAFKSTII